MHAGQITYEPAHSYNQSRVDPTHAARYVTHKRYDLEVILIALPLRINSSRLMCTHKNPFNIDDVLVIAYSGCADDGAVNGYGSYILTYALFASKPTAWFTDRWTPSDPLDAVEQLQLLYADCRLGV